MKNINLLRFVLSKETIFILGLTILGYCTVLSLEAGTCDYYGIYIGFIDIGMINVFENIITRILPSAFLAYIYASYGNDSRKVRIAKVAAITIVMIIWGYKAEDLYSHAIYVTFFVTLFIFFIYFFARIRLINDSNFIFIIVLSFLFVCAVFYVYGKYSAFMRTEFNTFSYNNKQYAVLRVYNNSILAGEIIENTFANKILYIPSNQAEIVELSPLQEIKHGK